MLIKALSEHVFHEKVYLIDGTKLLHIRRMLELPDLSEIPVLSRLHILVKHQIINGSLLPPILYVPIELPAGPLLQLSIIGSSLGVVGAAILSLLLHEFFPGGAATCRERAIGGLGRDRVFCMGCDKFVLVGVRFQEGILKLFVEEFWKCNGYSPFGKCIL